jgi:HSP20 family protein
MADRDITKKENKETAVTRREQQRTYMPATDIRETPEAIVMQFDMPGVEKDKVNVKLDRNLLAVTGIVERQEQGNIVYQEYRIGDYHREFTLSDDLDKNNITAEMKAGVLTLTIGKAEKAKPKTIQIASGD